MRRFDTASSTPKITFKPVRFLEANEITQAIEQGKTDAALKAITMTVAQTDGVQKLAAPVAQAPTEEQAEEAPEAVVAEPTKVTKKKDEVAAKKDLASILSEFDD